MREDTKDFLAIVVIIIGVAIMSAVFGYGFSQDHNRSEIGDEKVPHNLDCAEDEVIGFGPLDESGPRPLTCVHIENYVGEAL